MNEKNGRGDDLKDRFHRVFLKYQNSITKRTVLVCGAVFGTLFVTTAAISFFWGTKHYDTSRYTDVGDGQYAKGMHLVDGRIVKDDVVTTEIPEGDMTPETDTKKFNKNGDAILSYNETSGWSSSIKLIMDELDCDQDIADMVMQAIYDQTAKTGHTCYSISGIRCIASDLYQVLTTTNRLYEFEIDPEFNVSLKKEVFDVEDWVK